MDEVKIRRTALRAGGGLLTSSPPSHHHVRTLRSERRGSGSGSGSWSLGRRAAVLALFLGINVALHVILLRWIPAPVPPATTVAASSVPAVLGLAASMALLPSSFRPSAPQRRRVLLVSLAIDGPNVNSGIGRATLRMARLLARRHDVTLLHATGDVSPDSLLSFDEWAAQFEQQYGLSLLALSAFPSHVYSAASYEQERSYELMLWLIQHSAAYDIVHVHDWSGLAYYPLLTAGQGHPQLQRLTFVIVSHSQTLWAALANAKPPDSELALKTDFMERESVRLSPYVVWPSAYMQQWMAQHQYGFTTPLLLQQPQASEPQLHEYSGNLIVMRKPVILEGKLHVRTSSSPLPPALLVRELVFVGRLEARKGLDLFLDAASAVEERIRSGQLTLKAGRGALRFTLIGKQSVLTSAALRRRVEVLQSLPHWRVLSNYSAAETVAYLREVKSGRLAVMPSRVDNSPYTVQEALLYGLPFMAADVGGVAELIHEDDRLRVTFPPSAERLAERLSAALADRFVPGRPSFDAAQDAAEWLDWHDSLQLPARRVYGSEKPFVSVVMATYSRSELVLEALQSLLEQTYDRELLEVIVVNDGTSDVESLAYYEQVAAFVRLQPRWQYLVVPHAGESLARNAGSERAKGEFLLFMDDDNLAEPGQVAAFVRAVHHTGVDVLTCMAETFSGSRPGDEDGSSYQWIPLGPAASLSLFHNVIGDSNFLIRSSTFRRFGGFAADVVGEDRELLTRLLLGGARMQLLPHVLLWKRSTRLSRLHIRESVSSAMAVVDAFLGPDVPHELGLGLLASREMLKRAEEQQLHLASSGTGYGDKQGWSQWHYHYRTSRAPGDGAQEEQEMVVAPKDGEDGGSLEWQLPASASASACFIRAHSQQPCMRSLQPVSVLRSWLANRDCSIVLTGRLWKERHCRGAATRVWIELETSDLFEVELRAGETAALPDVEAVLRFGQSLYIGARAAHSLSGQRDAGEAQHECHEVGVDVSIALKPRPLLFW